MRFRHVIAGLAAVTAISGCVAAPLTASAQDHRDRDHNQHRRDKRNEWKNIAIGAGALGVLGLLTHDNTLFFAGTGGALYSAYRYNQDRHSHDRRDRLRAEYFSRPYFDRDGVRYDRREVWQNGQKYYRFERER